MNRTMLTVLVCLAVGAGGMWVASNFRVKFESVGGPTDPPPAPTTRAEAPPQTLPPHLLSHPAGGIQQAGGVLPLAVGATAFGVGADPTKVADSVLELDESISIGGTATPVSWGTPVVLRLATNSVRVSVPVRAAAVVDTVTVGDKPFPAAQATTFLTTDHARGQFTLNFAAVPDQATTPKLKPGQTISVVLARKETVGGKDFVYESAFTVVRPLSAEKRFFVDSVATTDGLPPGPPGGTVDVYGGYLRVRGRAVGGFSDPKFFYLVGGRVDEVPKVQAVAPLTPTGDWEYQLTLPSFNRNERPVVFARGDFTDGHTFATTTITTNINLPPTPGKPAVAVRKSDDSGNEPLAGVSQQTAGLPTYFLNRRTIKVRVTPAGTGDKAVTLYLDDRAVETRAVDGTTATTPLDFDIPALGDGRDHVLKAVGRVAESTSPPTQVAVKVVTTRPAVEGVLAPGFGQSNGVGSESIRVRFSGDNPLSTGTVINANFKVTHNEGATPAATLVTAGTLGYDEPTNTVTLAVSPVKPGSYKVQILKPVTDVFGNPLAVTPGLADGTVAYETVLFTGAVDAPQPSQSAGVTLGTGPNVTFPEYTRFRHVPDGFNPSDRVETRVVRLYYSRDAHRVAQVINRDVKSYNAAAVDVRRRAADRSRDDANAATDARKRLEGDAVNAAADTRAAEARLRDLQTRLANARNEGVTATTQLGQRQQQLEQFQRTFGREQTNVGVRRDTDATTDAARARLDRLTADVAQAEATVKLVNQNVALRPAELDNEILSARTKLGNSQQAFATAFSDAKADVEKADPVVGAAVARVTKLEQDLRNPNLSGEQFARLDADLTAARQARDAEIQNAVVRSPRIATLRKLSEAAQADQLAYERQVNARDALTALPTLRVAAADAQREFDRAKVVAGGRANTDTGADAAQDTTRQLQTEIATLNRVASTATATRQAVEADIATATGEVQAKRAREVELNLRVREADQRELRGREDQHRREVAAATADPDTYAAGDPTSDDPVRQCSISVIGEGLIQIRGPVKGLNVIRTMINQMDAPTGQVRVGVHTFQVNGEKADRMDRVAANIQRYLDHSRFLTTQSAQMLRKAVTLVASRKAEEAAHTVAPGCSKAEQEAKYLHCFFGKDFVEELRQLDSEFLRTGNKLLSLHSMDSTSLSSALFLLALAKNDIRSEILHEWQTQLQTKLPDAELAFYTAGLSCADRCEACGDKKFCVLAQNARFESFLGFFNAEVQGADTLTPIQREFVRLAQIFKVRLVTELELKQRVMERTLLEERVGRNYLAALREATDREDEAKKAVFAVQDKMQRAIAEATLAFNQADQIQRKFETDLYKQDVAYDAIFTAAGYEFPPDGRGGVRIILNSKKAQQTVTLDGMTYTLPDIFEIESATAYDGGWRSGEEDNVDLAPSLAPLKYKWFLDRLADTRRYLYQFYYVGSDKYQGFKETIEALDDLLKAKSFTMKKFTAFHGKFKAVLGVIRENIKGYQGEVSLILTGLRKEKPNVTDVLTRFTALRADVFGSLREGGTLRADVEGVFTNSLDGPFRVLQQAAVLDQAAGRRAALARRPLDEKKLLDMLVDEMEDKYIELLDGTRAHTANVDNYLKALATALDDDFNTQFYTPAFRRIRVAAATRDVQLGQIDSTSVLTNNRVLGKVTPAASMEFDLPRRDILVKEAFDGAKKAVQDYGALLNDPIFLNMVKMYGGLPPSGQYGGAGGGMPAVRNVLPGLPSSADEMLLAQGGSPRREFGTNLDSLVPDPAVYKFETGTGYEIRPVLSPDGQAVVFGFDYMYTTDVREPVRADEKHLGRVKRHFLHTDVQLGNYELREVSKYWVTLKAARTARGVPLLENIPGVGALFRPPPSAGSSLQQNLIYSQATIFPTLFDLMGLRYAPAVADIDPEHTKNDEFVVRGRRDYLRQFIFDYGASRVDDALRILYGERRPDLYRSQHSIPFVHPNGYQGPGLRQRDAALEEGYDPTVSHPPTKYAPGMHTPLPTDRDRDQFPPYGPIEYGGSGRRLPPPGGFPPLSARPPVGGQKEYTARPLGTTVTPDELPPPRPTTPTVAPPAAARPTLPTPAPVPARPLPPLEPSPLSGRTGVNATPYTPR